MSATVAELLAAVRAAGLEKAVAEIADRAPRLDVSQKARLAGLLASDA
ncbi:hypothetical protein [Occultella kanbiaonis]|nr:hypothetical protein [Occultella kanbiaonis]